MNLDIELQENSDRPVYRLIASQLAEKIRKGELAVGTRLPNHRSLAAQLRVAVGTVSRAYQELQAANLLVSGPGRGTFVSGNRDAPAGSEEVIDLRNYSAATNYFSQELASTLMELAANPSALPSSYKSSQGPLADREAGALWLERTSGAAVAPENIVITNGVQHALLCCLGSLLKAGDFVITESLTYPGLMATAEFLGLKLCGVEIDHEGFVPEALAGALRNSAVKAVVTVPRLHNPTTACASPSRRKDLLEIFSRFDGYVLEDDVYGCFLGPSQELYFNHLDERAILLSSLSKGLAPSLRVGYAALKSERIQEVVRGVRASAWMAPPISVLVASKMIHSGSAFRILNQNSRELSIRNRVAMRIFGEDQISGIPNGPHVWVRLPQPWSMEKFLVGCLKRGVQVQPASEFALTRTADQQSFRVNIGAARSVRDLETALSKLLELMERGPSSLDTFA
ncbi:PLP-dependent aminotransferase family protein [Bradyrhizobium zhanjiangense]|uniref:PLP-dependent aminotransferase family protein n=1 Tax=Bradyrhizobium zhanjiangense TaxID=1325107 RepID=A0A4Q0Q6J4_9BRAD|nr:PLP-dependent aminotransferase family protein [Bradyrhizobium zhanjiangense]RXG83890.1 PLP-dependent aminotransferase family protein [Bradyrhizobium zhanjiangense]